MACSKCDVFADVRLSPVAHSIICLVVALDLSVLHYTTSQSVSQQLLLFFSAYIAAATAAAAFALNVAAADAEYSIYLC
jgi:hypothetical protein